MRPPVASAFGRIKAHPPPASPGQAIGLLGGSFNPPHAAHRMISETALKRLGLDKVWWIVSPGNPLKRGTDAAPFAERLVQCRAMAKNPHIVVTDFEADLDSPFTASTLAFLKTRNPLVRFVWIMGADNLAGFHRWLRWREIFTMAPIAVVDRPGWRMKALASKAARAYADARVPETEARGLVLRPPPAWTFLTGPLSQLSSTSLRNKGLRRGAPVARKTHRRGRNGANAHRGAQAMHITCGRRSGGRLESALGKRLSCLRESSRMGSATRRRISDHTSGPWRTAPPRV